MKSGSRVAVIVSLTTLVASFGGIAAARIPVHGFHPVPGQPMELVSGEPSSVHAVAVTGPHESLGEMLVARYDIGSPTAADMQEHVDDPDARHSRVEAWAAAHAAIGKPVQEWVIVADAGKGAGQVMRDLKCEGTECTAVLVNGGVAGVDLEAGADVSFTLADPQSLEPHGQGDPPVSMTLAGWVGGSAGLAYALAYVEYLTGEPVTPPGMLVAATGSVIVAPNGSLSVNPVDAIPQKMESAAIAGAQVLFIPPREGEVSGPLPVVEVESVFGALEWLCRHGSEHSRCTPEGLWDPRATT